MDTLQPVANNFLSRILRDKRLEVSTRKTSVPQSLLEKRARAKAPALPVLPVLRGDGLRVIAEIKRASPSAGAFAGEMEARIQVARYARGGASAISVLTDQPYFQGSLSDLEEARAAVSVPLLRKDFIVDPYQVHEARAAGADFVLLIVAALRPDELASLFTLTESLGMTALVEVNTVEEARLADQVGARLVGINNRDLHTFKVDMGTTARVRPLLSPGTIVASLSGVRTVEEARAMRAAGADAVLVGEALARSAEPERLLAQFTAVA